MFPLNYLTAKLYPGRNADELQKLTDRCFEFGDDYNEQNWLAVTKEQLSDESVQLNLIATLHRSQKGYWGVVEEIMRRIEEWSDGSAVIKDLPQDLQDFYERLYGFFGWINFPYISFERQMFLLGTRFLLYANAWDIDIYYSVQLHFARYGLIETQKSDSDMFLFEMRRNYTPLGDPQRTRKEVKEWLKDFDNYPFGDSDDRVTDFMTENLSVSRLDEVEKKTLKNILNLYFDLETGAIWRSIDFNMLAGWETKEKVKNLRPVSDYYLSILYNADHHGFLGWLKDYPKVLEWLWATEKNATYIKKLVFIIAKHLDLNSQEEVNLALGFLSSLKDGGIDNADKVLYFDEQTGKFNWDEDYLRN